jgi:hypothetical protein
MPRTLTFMPSGASTLGRLTTGQPLGRDHRLALRGPGDAGHLPDDLVGVVGHRGTELGVDALAQHDHVARVAAAGEDLGQPGRQRQRGDEDRHRQPDADGRHQGRALALEQVRRL